MTRRIHVLPDAVANQIAAGEVVERPASVVKELVENALDARATRVEVAIERGGKRRIRVSDDGIGMGREDALLSFDRHATSKIRAADDLHGVGTFGFRGEAIPSIAAVSRLTLESHDGEGEVGTRISVAGGRIDAVEDHPRRRGTTIEVRNLFFNAPVRARFLKSVRAEVRAASEVVTSLALANPSVAFRLTSDGRPLLDLAAASDPGERVAQIWGSEQGDTLVFLSGARGEYGVRGLVQRPDAAKPGIRRSHLFVNGRPFRSPAMVRAVERGYRTTIPPGTRPWIFLYIDLPGDQVDVNVHPAKAEVRFRDSSRVQDLIEEAVRHTLGDEESAATLAERGDGSGFLARDAGTGHSSYRAEPALRPRKDVEAQMALFMSGADPEGGSAAEDGALRDAAIPVAAPGAGRPRLWQALDTYVLVETRDGILIVDQHSAHERILFQRLMDGFDTGGQESQRLLFPMTLRLTAPEVAIIEDLSGLLSKAGFEVEGFGGDTVIVHAVPNPHRYFDAERAFREMVHELTHGSDLVRAAKNQHERIAMTFACKGAIKAGQKLSEVEMQELFDQLFATELPHHDVHGRPTIVRLSGGELERKFGRT